MSNLVQDKLGEREYFHGTHEDHALRIMYEGFNLRNCATRSCIYKQGIYLTKSLYTAASFGPIVFKCHLAEGVSILWTKEHYDQKVIDSLRREFGKEILNEDISKVIPSNKHLNRKELINLLNYRLSRKDYWKEVKRKTMPNWGSSISSIRRQLQFHKYTAMGDTESVWGLVVFNPSFVKPIYTYYCPNRNALHFNNNETVRLKEVDKVYFVKEVYRYIVYMRNNFPDDQIETDRIGLLLERYCRENGLRAGNS
jgi:hypothetical protein